ncbi:MAG: hypothetical protein KDB53_01335, partial [Planctomycetes bacterium]|nr:hypothetical protein [Planctomycetota bacterium]
LDARRIRREWLPEGYSEELSRPTRPAAPTLNWGHLESETVWPESAGGTARRARVETGDDRALIHPSPGPRGSDFRDETEALRFARLPPIQADELDGVDVDDLLRRLVSGSDSHDL